MPTLEEIKTQIQHIDGVSKLLGRKEIKELPNILWEDEIVEKMVQGQYNTGIGILVATNKRLLFVDKGLIYGLHVEDFPYDKITSIQYKTGLLYGEIKIFASGKACCRVCSSRSVPMPIACKFSCWQLGHILGMA